MRPEIKYGLLAGAGMCFWICAEFFLGLHASRHEIGQYSGVLSNLILLGMLYLLLRAKRDASPGRRLEVAEGIWSGVAASLIAALIVYGFAVAHNLYFDPGWIDNALDWKVARWRAQGIAETDIRRQITFFRHTNSPTGLLTSTLATVSLTGAIFSLGLTLFFRQRSRRDLT